MEDKPRAFDPHGLERPDRSLLKYYAIAACLAGPFWPFAFVPLYFKYHTLRYKFDPTGVSMSWGILFKREIHLTYRRIQDIHLTRNFVQRWMGLATVAVQTASGSAGPEMSIEGVLEASELRDYLYAQMRGARGEDLDVSQAVDGEAPKEDALSLLREIRDALRTQASSSGDQA